jgi:predicted negative regulator of RcsB-dependent stress response
VGAAAALSAQEPQLAEERLGTVHFETSCAPAVALDFDRAVALLHSFEFGASIRGFERVLASDASCAMAYWGLALSRWTNPMAPGIRSAQTLEPGRQAAQTAQRLAAGATERERDYVAAVGKLYEEYERRDQQTRAISYAEAMRDVAAKHPQDTEAKIFYAIALTASADPTDKSYANQLRAGAILEEIFARQPDHPGLAHYIIHSYDVPALASQARAAAVRYADIAPSAAHALHMPSHTFTRIGMWLESVGSNLRSMEVAESSASIAETLHAADYAVYAYLQMRDEAAAVSILARLPALASRFDPAAVTGAAPGSAGVFALAAMPARYALERRAWADAAALLPNTSTVPYADALTHFARALGAAHLGDQPLARASVDSLAALRDRLSAQSEAYWTEQVEIQRLGASAWLELSNNRNEQALALMREAAAREDATEKAAVTPGPLAPARELLGDMLLELGRPAEALAEYRSALTREPNRYWTLEGARKAAAAAGDGEAAAEFERLLKELTGGQS